MTGDIPLSDMGVAMPGGGTGATPRGASATGAPNAATHTPLVTLTAAAVVQLHRA